MFLDLLELLLGCKHKRFSFPQTVRGRTYCCCLECGKEFDYEFEALALIRRVKGK